MLFMQKCWFYHYSWLDCLLSMISSSSMLAVSKSNVSHWSRFANDNEHLFPRSMRQESKLHHPASNYWYEFFAKIYTLISGHSPSVAIIVELVAGRRKTDEWLERLAQILIHSFVHVALISSFILLRLVGLHHELLIDELRRTESLVIFVLTPLIANGL